MAEVIFSNCLNLSATSFSFPVPLGQGTNTSLKPKFEVEVHGLIGNLLCNSFAIGLTQVASSPGPLETITTTREGLFVSVGSRGVKRDLKHADGET